MKFNLRKTIKKIIITIASALVFFYFYIGYPFWGMFFNEQRQSNPPMTPAWALECWLWEDDVNSADRVDTLLQGYAKYDIPVRTILIDSPWSTHYNNFEPDTILYPKPKEWFQKLQTDGYRVVLWMTTMVDSKSKDTRIIESESWFNNAKDKGYIAANGNQISWWKGKGGFIDYTSDDAMRWWRGMQQKVFDYGIDGWKLDGTCTLFFKRWGFIPFFYQRTKSGWMTTRTYMDHYYRDEYRHGLTQNPEFVTLSRSIDRVFHPEGFAPLDAAPVTWVGDQKHTWESAVKENEDESHNSDIAMVGIDGIGMAIQNILNAANLRYNIIGSDVAGFSGKTIPPRLYIRWAQFSAFCGLFLNGGHGERALWKRSQQELEIIRQFSWLHTELIPYIYSYVVTGHEGGKVLQKPVKGKYHYLFGEDFLVAPIFKDALINKVTLPEGKWRYFFNDQLKYEGSTTFEKEFPLDEFPVFVREGAIIPMNIKRSYTGLGTESNAGFVTWLVYPGINNSFTLFHPDKSGSTTVNMVNNDNGIELSIKDAKKPSLFSINFETKPSRVLFNNVLLVNSVNYSFDLSKNKLTVKINEVKDGVLKIFN